MDRSLGSQLVAYRIFGAAVVVLGLVTIVVLAPGLFGGTKIDTAPLKAALQDYVDSKNLDLEVQRIEDPAPAQGQGLVAKAILVKPGTTEVAAEWQVLFRRLPDDTWSAIKLDDVEAPYGP